MHYVNKKNIIATLLVIFLSTSIISLPSTHAQTSGQMKSYAFLAVEPNPVGVGQTTYVAMWIDVPLPGAS